MCREKMVACIRIVLPPRKGGLDKAWQNVNVTRGFWVNKNSPKKVSFFAMHLSLPLFSRGEKMVAYRRFNFFNDTIELIYNFFVRES